MPTDTVRSPLPALPEAASDLRTFPIADVRGYTRFTPERGGEAAARLAARFTALAREGVAQHGGQVLDMWRSSSSPPRSTGRAPRVDTRGVAREHGAGGGGRGGPS